MTSARIHAENWQMYAACRGMDSELFIPDTIRGGGGRVARIYNEAKKVCAGCPVVAECLQFALSFEGRSCSAVRRGVYGGKTPAERAVLARGKK